MFALALLEKIAVPARQEIFATAMVTVALSVVSHGLTAYPLAKCYARRTQPVADKPAAEHEPLTEMPFHRQY